MSPTNKPRKLKDEQVAFRVESALKADLQIIADREERTLTQVVRQALKKYVELKRAAA